MARPSLTATGLRLTLSISLFAIAIGASVAIHFLHQGMDSFAAEVSHATADATASGENIQALQKIQKGLEVNRTIIERASSIVAESQSYEYQDQVINDLNGYASRAGVAITNIEFPTSSTGSPGVVTPGTVTPNGVKSTSVSITLKNPVDYNSLLRFVHSIEQNLTKMQISRIGLAKATANNVTSEVLSIEVYVK